MRKVHNIIRQTMAMVVTSVAFSFLASCGSDGPMESEDYGDLLSSPAGLVVVEEEHPTGYGRPDCLVCHELRNIHAVNRTSLPSCDGSSNEPCIDLEEIRATVRTQREASCGQCHGNNGVEP